jgi:hypothetical protein
MEAGLPVESAKSDPEQSDNLKRVRHLQNASPRRLCNPKLE